MLEMFKLGGAKVTREELQKMLLKSNNSGDIDEDDEFEADSDMKTCDNFMIESFLNGFIIFKRGKLE